MSTGKTNRTSTQFAAKKLLGKAHTSNIFSDVNESIPSNVSVPSNTVFASEIPNSPPTASFIASGSVEKVHFDVVSLSNTIYDADDTDGGGDEASTSGAHGYYLKLPYNYETTSSNPLRGTGSFANGTRVYNTRGALQLVPPLISNANPNLYFLKLYKGAVSDANEITSGDSIDWQIDYYSGVVFIQDYNSSNIPVSASGYLYVGDYLDAKITEISSSSGGTDIIVKEEGSNITTSAASFDFVGTGVTATNSGNDVTVTIAGGINYSRTAVTSTTTSSVSDRILGVSASAALEIRLPAATGFSSGQYFTIKDEGGSAETNNITILTTGDDTIDGVTSITIESAHGAVNLYSDGSSKFFIY
tara:strand:+ start:139 stop:1218 length:1080 start_codon:yes stop_codon:yes gene_type:complete